ncbi:hypothetical protein M6D81_02790 [Paenibacillus sp. J5C_2022]|nr:hypothetical protein [Paenibacillus sp. J5C2022]MCU6707625.1 hypothetical protein [Paenibacillus sp. J5C2022]
MATTMTPAMEQIHISAFLFTSSFSFGFIVAGLRFGALNGINLSLK